MDDWTEKRTDEAWEPEEQERCALSLDGKRVSLVFVGDDEEEATRLYDYIAAWMDQQYVDDPAEDSDDGHLR